jgi:hypothetical protein
MEILRHHAWVEIDRRVLIEARHVKGAVIHDVVEIHANPKPMRRLHQPHQLRLRPIPRPHRVPLILTTPDQTGPTNHTPPKALPDPFVGGGSQSDVYPASASSGIFAVISTHEVLKYCNIVSARAKLESDNKPRSTSQQRNRIKCIVKSCVRWVGGMAAGGLRQPKFESYQIWLIEGRSIFPVSFLG